ncbi:endonuclease/exonuclease/phosphatase family protein [Roseibacterium sp. SDUM158016]|uniref:endonuclease/exonuclease/phosphatase family protein n=1 Tax=Roseicyclus sediminis TaxID=2980997 RepID=UPI0021CE0A8A|nr:endonuclease/exonuclease/phosphatase family protein [Roseibacterium sp. SDUM158016]MCU4653251.1 endonuclease/exonuclease/phosphatase family protein [Roseibacterium sp. SDUM158016]
MQLKIASYNIRKAVGRDRRRDPARILGVLCELDADVVVLQEADRRLGARPTAIPRNLIALETDYVVADVARNDVSLGWHGNAILVRRGIEIGQTGHIELPGLEPRGAVLAEIAGMTVIGTHLGFLRRWRHLQMNAILRYVADRPARTLIAGDFNEWSDIRGFDPWEQDFSILYPGRSFPTPRAIASLDGIAHGAAIAVQRHGVLRSPKARTASDHFPIWATVETAGS